MNDAIAFAANLIAQADSLIIAAGAGMGVDSGLPDFRRNDGFWKAYPALGNRGMDFTDIASPAAFRADPSLAWGFYGHRLNLYRRTVPHAGFGILRGWAARMQHGAQVFTSNVDGQFQAAGFTDDQVFECHGSIHALQCLVPCSVAIWPATGFDPIVDDTACRLLSEVPRCPKCGGLARPNILMFDDWGWIDDRSETRARLERWVESVSRPVVIEIGAGTAVPSVRHFAKGIARQFGGRIVRINPTDCVVPDGQGVGISMGALDALRRIDSAWTPPGDE
jgi:NAD-dependent SIR2 family protein deacetylase